MKEIYLDYAATTKPLPSVIEKVSDVMANVYGNPSSLHKKGIQAENIIKESSAFFASALGCKEDEIIYTSGGTESNNLAIIGTAMAYKRTGNKIITTAIEHPSVGDVFSYLETQGFEIVRLEVDHKGSIALQALEEAIDEETLLVSTMYVNNEIGTIQEIEAIGKCIKAKNPQTLFHVDAVQAFGKLPIHVRTSLIDLLSISSHKFYGPKGVGILYKHKNVRLLPLVHGGGQQKNSRSGTENVPGIAGMHTAAKYCYDHFEALRSNYQQVKSYLATQILEHIEDTHVNGPSLEEGAPHILNMAFKNVRAEVLLHALEQQGIYVSSGSACSSNKVQTSKTLTSIGCTADDLDNAIRFSFGYDCTKEDMDVVIEVLKKQVMMLRKFIPGGKKR
ncbi:MAG: cysteine desulfurase family protein [Cellulosilyticaceae bacterium]